MKFRNTLKILVILGILFYFVNGISEHQNQVLPLEFILLYTVIWITEYYLFERNEIPKISDFKLDLGELRELTDTEKNRLPVRLNSLIVAEGEIPDWIVVAGGPRMVSRFPSHLFRSCATTRP